MFGWFQDGLQPERRFSNPVGGAVLLSIVDPPPGLHPQEEAVGQTEERDDSGDGGDDEHGGEHVVPLKPESLPRLEARASAGEDAPVDSLQLVSGSGRSGLGMFESEENQNALALA